MCSCARSSGSSRRLCRTLFPPKIPWISICPKTSRGRSSFFPKERIDGLQRRHFRREERRGILRTYSRPFSDSVLSCPLQEEGFYAECAGKRARVAPSFSSG